MENNNILDLTKEELVSYINTERKIYCADERYLFKEYLINAVSKVLDIRDLAITITQEEKRVRKMINKYAKPCKKEKDMKRLLKKQKELIDTVMMKEVDAVTELMYIVDMLINDDMYHDLFIKELPALEDYYQLKMEDMVLVNGVLRELKKYNSENINEEIVFNALNYAISEYIVCIENDNDYTEYFESGFPFVLIYKCETKDSDEEESDE